MFACLLCTALVAPQTRVASPKPIPDGRAPYCIAAERKYYECFETSPVWTLRKLQVPAALVQRQRDGFSVEMQYWLRKASEPPRSLARDLGEMAGQRILEIRYYTGKEEIAAVVAIEASPGEYHALMRWQGGMPRAVWRRSFDRDVLVVEMDFGGNIPMVSTWAWTWDGERPVRVDVRAAVSAGIRRVVRDRGWYSTSIDWRTLHYRTGAWSGVWQGKPSVREVVELWFGWEGSQLTPVKVQWRDLDAKARPRAWP